MIISSIVAVVRQELVVHDIHEFMLSDWSMRVIFGEGSSLIGPCQPVFEVTISMLMAMYWSLKRFSFRKLSVCGVLAICLIFSIRSHYYPRGINGPAKPWTSFSILDTAVGATFDCHLVVCDAERDPVRTLR